MTRAQFLMNDFGKSMNRLSQTHGEGSETTPDSSFHLMRRLDPRIQTWIAGSSPAMRA
jgi:hypothetical protein